MEDPGSQFLHEFREAVQDMTDPDRQQLMTDVLLSLAVRARYWDNEQRRWVDVPCGPDLPTSG